MINNWNSYPPTTPSLSLFLPTGTLVQPAMFFLTTCTTVINLLATTTSLEPGEQVLLLSTRSMCSRSFVVLQAIPVAKSGTTESASLCSVHTTTIVACSRSFYCCAEFHLFSLHGVLLVGYEVFKKKNYPDDFFLLLSVEKVLWSIKGGFGELLAPGGHETMRTLSSTVRVLKVFSAKGSVYFLLFRFSLHPIENSASSKYETNRIY